MDLVDGVAFEDGIRFALQADGVVDVPEDVAGKHSRGVGPVAGGDGIGIAAVGSLIILEDVGEGVSGDIQVAAEVQFLTA